MPLRIATAVCHHNGDLDGHTFLSDQVVEYPRNFKVGFPLRTIVANNERRLGSGAILGGNINGDLANVIDFVRVHNQCPGIFRIDLAEFLPRNAGVEQFGCPRVDRELVDPAFRNIRRGLEFRREPVIGANEIVAIGRHGRV